MDHDSQPPQPQQELALNYSPRLQVELTQELSALGEQEGHQHFHFEGDNNPFSYYHDDNQREGQSSEQSGSDRHPSCGDIDTAVSSGQNQTIAEDSSGFEKVEIGENLGHKPAIQLLQSPRTSKKTEIQANGTSSPQVQANGKSSKMGPSLAALKQPLPSLPAYSNPAVTIPTQPKSVSAADSAYKSELQKQMAQLRSNFAGKQQKKKGKIFDQKRQQKVNLNKTFAGVGRRGTRQGEMQFQQMRMLVKMAFEKKKANYEMLKEWDRRRAESLALHGKMIELLQNEVDTRIKSSLQNFDYYQTFFREKAKQEEKYASSPVINTRYALQNNSLSKNVYINCSVILNSLCDENTHRCKKINDFVQLIRHSILRELTETHLNSSQRELLKVREKISTLKSALKKQNAETEEKANELAGLFSEQAGNITNKTDKDFYRTQLSFLRKALQQIDLQHKLGEYCLEYYHAAVSEELKRSQVIREAMVTYSRGLKEAYGIGLELECAEIEQLSKHEEIKLIEEFYSLDEMFDERTVELFKARNHLAPLDDISIDSFTKYITHFDYHPFDSRVILLKEFTVRHTSGKNKEEESCYLVITVDNFLHLFLGQSRQGVGKPDVTIKISSKWLELRNVKDQYLDVVKREERRNSMMSYFWDNKVDKVYRIRFAKKDNKEEFMDYITKLMVDQF